MYNYHCAVGDCSYTQMMSLDPSLPLSFRYIDNLLSHPGEQQYRKIRANNKAFKERVACVAGGLLFLKAIGFTEDYCGGD